MSSPSQRFSFSKPRRDSHPGPLADGLTPSSLDPHHAASPPQGSQLLASSSSSARRPSSSQVQGSPDSMASISKQEEKSGWAGVGASEGRLPRIQTSNVDDTRRGAEQSNGPHSAPLNRSLRPPDDTSADQRLGGGGPLRSSSSPDPWLSHHSSSQGSSPCHSPTEYRSNDSSNGPSPSLGPAFSQSSSTPRQPSPGNIPPHAIPPRKSSTTDKSRPITPKQPQPAEGSSSQNTLSAPQSTADAQLSSTFNNGQGTLTPRNKRQDPSHCGQCGNVVHGQFVRAMGKVYHLNCFRCKVSTANLSTS